METYYIEFEFLAYSAFWLLSGILQYTAGCTWDITEVKLKFLPYLAELSKLRSN